MEQDRDGGDGRLKESRVKEGEEGFVPIAHLSPSEHTESWYLCFSPQPGNLILTPEFHDPFTTASHSYTKFEFTSQHF